MTLRVAINGFGRIGRLVYRSALEKHSNLEFVAINRGEPETVKHLLQYDSIHGKLPFDVEVDGNHIIVDGNSIEVLHENNPAVLPWKNLGVDLVIEASGCFRTRESVLKHLQSGAQKVLISAPCKNPDITLVMGVNDHLYDTDIHRIVSNASCTTNCLAPVAKVLHEEYTIKNGYLSTIHAFTNDQVLLDKSHKKLRRGRAGTMSIIPTSTGATSAIGEVMPELKGKLDGIAFRVPTPNVSIIDLVVELEKRVKPDQINESFREAAEGRMKGILGVSDKPLVSIDYVHTPHSAVVDCLETRVNQGKMAKVLAWYDNEWGYACRLVDVAEMMAAGL